MSAPNAPWTWITGAGSGIGAATALALAARGQSIVASGRRLAPLQALQQQAEPLSGQIQPEPLDVTDRSQVARCSEQLLQRLGPPQTLILCAGDHQPMPLDRLSSDTCRGLMEVNFFGVIHLLEAVLPAMRAQGGGQVLVLASLAGYRGLPTAAAYGASKAALINACEALALELRGSGVALKLINPGFVRTPLTDRNTFAMPFLIEAEEAAKHILRAMEHPGFETVFPLRFALLMKLLRLLPYRLYFPLVRRDTAQQEH